jgi:hypothetical protein
VVAITAVLLLNLRMMKGEIKIAENAPIEDDRSANPSSRSEALTDN